MIVKKGQRVNATFDTLQEAKEWALYAESSILAGEKLAQEVKPVSKSETLANLCARYAVEVSPQKRGQRWETLRLNAYKKYIAFNKPIQELQPLDLALWRDERLKSVSPATVNRDLNLISAVITHSMKEWRVPVLVNPVSLIRRPKDPPARKRRISHEERSVLVSALGWDMNTPPVTQRDYVAFAFLLALETAMRRSEILSLTWEDVFIEQRYVHLKMTKNGEERDVPLSSNALKLINILSIGRPSERLVPIEPGYLTTTFRKVKIEVGLKDLRFHDSRREAATELSKRLSNVLELAAVTGHKSLKILQGYYRPDPTFLAKKLE
ncbi:tyrosine-type recombinase/integrase [Entomobacter blattae]|uniref:Tyrosine recombinase XerC n=1 Tax=Entomobacter blattae TaxID=2762277 RepID=A0A7H1NP87_9PROT|nr:site-specific integrase [Entomobacter blattae]QNT77597.1 Tyrosine recombinase XerC [Entomobacter blattae]